MNTHTQRIAIIHGPNLNMLGVREQHTYGSQTLLEINTHLQTCAQKQNALLTFFQSNHEGALVDHIHSLHGACEGIVINAGAYTHTSIALRDALLSVSIPFVEVHLSNIYRRESFRHHSYLADIALGVVTGFGAYSYEAGLQALIQSLHS